MTPLPTLLRYGTGGESWASRYFNRFPMPKAFGNSLSLFLPTFGQTDCNSSFVSVNTTLFPLYCCIYFFSLRAKNFCNKMRRHALRGAKIPYN